MSLRRPLASDQLKQGKQLGGQSYKVHLIPSSARHRDRLRSMRVKLFRQQQRWRAAAEIPLGAVALLAVNVSLGNGLI
jgi:hypothetical protein